MVGKESNGYLIFQLGEDGLNQPVVEVFDGLELERDRAIVACLVAGFHVEIYEIIAATEGIDGSLCLTLEVGVVEACSAWYIDNTQAGITSDTTDEINSCDYGAATNLLKFFKLNK